MLPKGLIIVASLLAWADFSKTQEFYEIPNPFKQTDGYYLIEGIQTHIIELKSTKTNFQHIFNIETGQSFTVFFDGHNLNNIGFQIGDSKTGHTFSGRKFQKYLTCSKKDRKHDNHLFPWRYDLEADKDVHIGPRRFLVGVGAIWLNAIKRKIVSDQIGTNSKINRMNEWLMTEGNTSVKFEFETRYFSGDLDKSKLYSISVNRDNFQNTGFDLDNSPETYRIVVENFLFQTNYKYIKLLYYLLDQCRKKHQYQQPFPSLMRAITLSPWRLYAIKYIETKYGESKLPNSGMFDDDQQRIVWNQEYVSEWFSYQKRAQSMTFVGLSGEASTEHADTYLTTYSDKPGQLRVNYHYKWSKGVIGDCVSLPDPMRPQHNLMRRHIHFYWPGLNRTEQLTGLGALIMNAASMYYKNLDLTPKIISLNWDITNLNTMKEFNVTEWRFFDELLGYSYHFYFVLKDTEITDISDLVRIEIRNPNFNNNTSLIEDSSMDDTTNLLNRFDIVDFSIEESEKNIEAMLVAPLVCAPTNNDQAKEPQTDDVELQDPESSENDQEPNEIGSETDPNILTESDNFPDFFEILEGQAGYKMLSSIEMLSESSALKVSKILLEEEVDFENERATLKFYAPSEDGDSSLSKPLFEYYINYNSELIFKINESNKTCLISNSLSPWLRLFSSLYFYYKTPYPNSQETEASKPSETLVAHNNLRLYGVGALWQKASGSSYTQFIGVDQKLGSPYEKFHKLSWSMNDLGDEMMTLRFDFLFEHDQFALEKKNKKGRRANEFMDLHQITIAQKTKQTLVDKFKVTKLKFERELSHSAATLPNFCENAIASLHPPNLNLEYEIDWFSDFYGPEKSYTADYYVEWADLPSKGEVFFNKLDVSESFSIDGDTRGRIIMKGPENIIQTFFKSPQECYMYNVLAEHCEPISADILNNALNLDKKFVYSDTKSVYYGLYAILLNLYMIEDRQIQVHYKYDDYGTRYKIVSHRIQSFNVVFSTLDRNAKWFNTNGALKPYDHQYHLDRIEMKPDFINSDLTAPRANIVPLSIKSGAPIPFTLPKECSSNLQSPRQFPKISELIGIEGQFFMRSEIISETDLNGRLMDEWYFNRKIRIKTYNANHALDLLILADSKESFDLSLPFKCSSLNNSKLANFWFNDETSIESPAQLNFGPMMLWWNAERSSSELMPGLVSSSQSNEEVWAVKISDSFSYSLHFDRYTNKVGRQWHILDKIEIFLRDAESSTILEIDVINYRYDHDSMEPFRVPSGHDCQRNLEGIIESYIVDDLKFNLDNVNGLLLNYEASLTLFDGNSPLPSLSGTLVRSPSKQVRAHHFQKRYPDGNFKSQKTVYANSILYEIDLMNGQCAITYKDDYEWTLDFSERDKIVLTTDLINALFMNTKKQNFKLVNRYLDGDYHVSTYERSYENISKSLTNKIRVVRRYVALKNITESTVIYLNGAPTRRRDAVYVDVLMLNNDESKLEKMLSISLTGVEKTLFSDVVKLHNVGLCPSTDRGTFTVEFPLNSMIEDHARYFSLSLEKKFMEIISEQAKISEVQFDSTPKLDFSLNNMMRFTIKLLGPPTAILRFFMIPNARMNDVMSSQSETRLLSSIGECSKWCDQVNCLAMSFCTNRVCRVASAQVLRNNPADSPLSEPEMLSSYQKDDDCNYHYARENMPSLDAITHWFETQSNSTNKQKLNLFVYGSELLPTKIQRLDENSLALDFDDDGRKFSSADITGQVYAPVLPFHKLDPSRLSELNKNSRNKFLSIFKTCRYQDCLSECDTFSCILISYDQNNQGCHVVYGSGEFRALQAIIEPDESTKITVRNFLADYYRVDDTKKPNEIQYVTYEGFSALECAAACEAADGSQDEAPFDCFSFDYCSDQITSLVVEPRPQTKSLCYLQKLHMLSDEFDRDILAKNDHSVTQEVVCNHYSKFLTARYQQFESRKLSTNVVSALENIDSQNCAHICLKADDCWAFDHCFALYPRHIHYCHLYISKEISTIEAFENWSKHLEDELVVDTDCTTYLLKQTLTTDRNKDPSVPQSCQGRHDLPFSYLWVALGWVLAATSIGLIIQFVFVKFKGRPFRFKECLLTQ